MDKRDKHQRRKTPDGEEVEIIPPAPPGASFDTEEGRVAQGMRPDIGEGASEQEKLRDQEPKKSPEAEPKK